MEDENDVLIRFFRNLSLSQGVNREDPGEGITDNSLLYCTYTLGYTEQNIYNCKTCGVLSGICLGCCYNCHEGHEIIDIGPKKDFRCDCGLSKTPCNLFPYKTDNQNNYCHNFVGRFCVCDAYDCEASRDSDMHLCIGCYDWFHQSCIQIYNDCHNFAAKKFHQKNFPIVPENVQEYYFLCQKCLNSNLFLVNKFRNYFSLENPSENFYSSVEFYPYSVFIQKSWFADRCECLECSVLDQPSVQFKSFRKVEKKQNIQIEDTIMSGSHEDQIYIAHGISILREMLQQSLRESFRANFRTEVEALKKRIIEQRRRFI